MKRFVLTFFVTVPVLFICSYANAAMIDIGGGFVHDDTSGYVWNFDLSTYDGMGYIEQSNAIGGSTSLYDVNSDGGMDTLTWQYATREMVIALTEYSGFDLRDRLFAEGVASDSIDPPTAETLFIFDTLRSINGGSRWLARSEFADEMSFSDDLNGMSVYRSFMELNEHMPPEWPEERRIGAWTVATVSYGPSVPIPSTMLLLGSGVVLAGIRIRRKK